MPDISDRSGPAGFQSLPSELRHQIFKHIYLPWHFEYTQVHDSLPIVDPEFHTIILANLTSTPRFSKLPSIAPLLVCKAFHDAGRHIFESSFTGDMQVISAMIWREVHWTYGCIMAKTTTLIINYPHLKSFYQCRILERLAKLEKIVIVSVDPWNSSIFQRAPQLEPSAQSIPDNSESSPFSPSVVDLEGSELTRYVDHKIVDLSDTGFIEMFRHTPVSNPLGPEIRNTLHSMGIEIIRRLLVGIPLRSEYQDQGITVFAVMDFLKKMGDEGWDDSGRWVDESVDSYELVKKRLAMLRQEIV